MEYNLGLDIGTNSTGFAATDDNKHLLRAKSSEIIGDRLYGSAAKAEERRGFRTTRRRLKRRKWRLGLLNEIFGPHLAEIDENFLPRLRQSNLVGSDPLKAGVKSYLFGSENDHKFREENPTIYHLRKRLMKEKHQFDLREVYLAMHHVIKYRGNFLYGTPVSQFKTGELNLQGNFRRLNSLFEQFMPETPFKLDLTQLKKVEAILLDDTRQKSDRQRELVKLIQVESENKTKNAVDKAIATNLLKAVLGLKVKFDSIFQVELDKDASKDWSFSLSDADVEDKQDALFESLDGNQVEIFNILSTLYSSCLLASILDDGNGGTFPTVSDSMVYQYKQHQDHLELLKTLEKQVPDEAATKLKSAYDAYIDGIKGKKLSQEDFGKAVKKQLDDSEVAKQIEKEIDLGKFMPKQRTRDNIVIPHQLHQQELDKIIENQSKYYPWLAELNPNQKRRKDAKYLLDELVAFRIPYYVGPLITADDQKKSSNASFAWMVRKEPGRITPWNFEQKVNKMASSRQFIRRMTATDKFLLGEPVLPMNSLLYQHFMVLNELNMIKINGQRITLTQKQNVFEKLFKQHKNVTVKSLQSFLRSEGEYKPSEGIEITGLSDPKKFNSKLSTYLDLKNIFGSRVDHADLQEDFEHFIEWSTTFEEGSIYQETLQTVDWLTVDEIQKLSRLHYKGWGNLSHKLLAEVTNNQGERIIDELWNTNQNFQQIQAQDDFQQTIQQINQENLTENSVDNQIDDLRTSPENKRAIRQVISVVEDLKKVMNGTAPQRLYVEFARDEENLNHTRSVSRADQVKQAYQVAAQEISNLPEFRDQDADSNGGMADKVFLYYMQMGKDIYDGRPINIDELPNYYEIDHIVPRSFMWDNSLDNRVLTKSTLNKEKGDQLPQKLYGQDMHDFWNDLNRLHLISNKKYHNLTLDDSRLTKYGIQGFINRQLVDTRQIIKYAVEILANTYPDTEIVTIKADLNHQFRQNYHLYKNREVNDYHHGFDAYLSAFIGQYLLETYPKLRGYLVYGDYSKKISDDFHLKNLLSRLFNEYNAADKLKDRNEPVDLPTNQQRDIFDYLVHVYFFKKILISKAVHFDAGAFYGQTLYKAIDDASYGKKGQNKKLIPAKDNRPTELYGGYTKRLEAFMALIKIEDKKGSIYQLKGIPVLNLFEVKQTSKPDLKDKVKKILVDIDPKLLSKSFEVLIPIIQKNQLFVDGKKRFTMGSSTVIHNAQQLILSWHSLDVLRKAPKNLHDDDNDDLMHVYDEILEQVEQYYSLYDKNRFREGLKNGREKFQQLPVKSIFNKNSVTVGKREVLGSILQGLHANAAKPDLKIIGIKTPFGFFQDKNGFKLSPDAQIIYQSPTGLFERKLRVSEIK